MFMIAGTAGRQLIWKYTCETELGSPEVYLRKLSSDLATYEDSFQSGEECEMLTSMSSKEALKN